MSSRLPAGVPVLIQRWLPRLLILNLLLLGFYLAFDYQLTYHSDSAVKNLLAQEIVDTGQYFPHDWNYANGDLWVFYTQTWIVPLLYVHANGFVLHVMSDLCTAVLAIGAAWWLCAIMGQSRSARLLSLCVLTAGISQILAEHIYGQAAYGSMFYVAGFLIGSYWKLSHAQGRARWLWGAAVLLLLVQVFWSNPQRGLVFYLLPLLAAAATLYGLDWQAARQIGRRAPARQLWQAALAVLGMLLGTALHAWTMKHVNNDSGETLVWLSMADMARNLGGIVSGMMSLLDGVPLAGKPIMHPFSAYQAPRILIALLMLFLLPWALWKSFRTQQRGALLVVVFTAASTGLNLFIVGTTSVADMASPEASVRYLVPSLMLLLIIMSGVIVDRRSLATLPRVCGWTALLVLATSAPFTYFRPLTDNLDMPWQGPRLVTRDLRMINFLDSQGLKYGYSTFWNAGKHSVLSGQRIRIRQIITANGLPIPMRKLSSNRWYNPDAWQGPTFLLLSTEEKAQINMDVLTRLAGPSREMIFEGWHILVFADNIAAHLPDWDTRMAHKLEYPVTAVTPHLAGKLQGTPQALVAAPGEAGALQFGPFRTVTAGRYVVGFELETAGEGGNGAADYGWVDVVAAGGKVQAEQRITAVGRQRIALAFDTPKLLNQLEFRVVSSGKGQITVYGSDIERAPQEKH